MFLRKLAVSNFVARKTRAALTIAAIALSVSLVVAVTSGYASVRAAVQKYMEQTLGTIDAQVSRQNDPRGPITEDVLTQLRQDPQVKRAVGRVELESGVLDAKGFAVEGRLVQVVGVEPAGDLRLEQLKVVNGAFFKSSDGNFAVIDQALAQKLLRPRDEDTATRTPPPGGAPSAPPKPADEDAEPDVSAIIGSEITLPGDRKVTLKIVGVIRKPDIMAQTMQSMYIPLRTLQRFQGWAADQPGGARVNRVTIEFQPKAAPREFETRWKARLAAIDPNLKLKLTRDIRDEMDRNMAGINLLSYMGGAVSMMSATFIVFSALSMGVTERQRSLAMLRAVGALRGQIGALVVVEGFLLALAGVAVGVPLGWLWVKILTLIYHDLFTAGVVVEWGGVALGSLGSMAAALGASVLPAWWATRVSPLEAMAPSATAPSRRAPLWAALAGALLVAIDPFLFYGPLQSILGAVGVHDPAGAAGWAQFFLHFFLGLPALFIGFFLLSPAVVWAVEWGVAPVVARIMGLKFALLRQQLSAGIWRAAGTCAALMVGLAVLVVMQVQGQSALKGWRLPTQFPDIFIYTPPGGSIGTLLGATTQPNTGVAFDQLQKLQTIPGIRNGEVMPVAVASPQFGHGMFGLAMTVMNPEATMFFGIDPHRAFKMMELDFRDGNAQQAEQLLADGKALILKPDQTVIPAAGFAMQEGQRVSKTKGVIINDAKEVVLQGTVTETPEGYSIALPGNGIYAVPRAQVEKVELGHFLVVTNEFKELKGLGVGDPFPLKRTAGGLAHFTIAGVVWSPGIDVIVSVFDMGRQFDQRTAASVFGTLGAAKDDFGVERIYLFAANLDWNVQKEDVLRNVKKKLNVEGFRAGDIRQIKTKIVQSFDRLLLLASSVAFAAMAVASLGVTNTIMAGIRTRRWQFGILRSIGVTRSQLLRIVVAEAVLLGIVAVVVGLAAGAVMSFDAHRLQVLTTGYNPDLSVPWGIIGIGVGIVLFISVIASLLPAISTARTDPLTLLQAGRAAT